MSKIKFNEFQRKQLENNPNVSHVSEQNISYKPEFKEKAVQENLAGKGPMDIFLEHGFDLKMIGPEKPKAWWMSLSTKADVSRLSPKIRFHCPNSRLDVTITLFFS